MGALISCSACSKSSPKVLTPQQCRIGLVQSPGHRHQIPGDALPAWLATLIIAASAGDPALSARLKALLREVKCLAQAV
jgi:hypothetical protein